MITLDTRNQFVTTEGKALGVFVSVKTARGNKRVHQYRGASGTLYASGMKPAEFVKRFWKRDDFNQDAKVKA